jgi:segregation and condensation protein B
MSDVIWLGAAPDADDGPPPPELLVPVVEACLFASAGVVTVAQLEAALRVPAAEVEEALHTLRARLARAGGGVRLHPVGEGWQLRTEARLARWVAAVRGGRPARLSRAALETLAVVAFRQPVGKADVDDIRGVDCGGVLKALVERGLVRTGARSDEPGRAIQYRTSATFLEVFGLQSLADLPTLRDLRAVDGDDAEAGPVEVVPFPEPPSRG